MTEHRYLKTLLAAGTAVLFAASLGTAQDVKRVQAEGTAVANQPQSREIALTEALREAVRKAVGIDLAAQTKVTNFEIDYDQVFTRSFGYVKSYQVVQSGITDDDTYLVRVDAEVAKGDPDISDKMAIQQLVRLKQSPKISLEVKEEITGLGKPTDYARAWLEQTMRDMNLRVIDTSRLSRGKRRRMAAKAEIFGDDEKMVKLRHANLAQEVDYVIEADVKGEYKGTQSLYGSLPFHVIELGIDLRVIAPDTGEVVIAIPLKSTNNDTSKQDTKEMALRELVHRKLDGKNDGSACGHTLFRKLFAQWTAELDMGSVIACEFVTLSDANYDKLSSQLSKAKGISSVWPGEFSARGLSYIDVETRLGASGLKAEVLKLIPEYELLERSKKFLQFAPKKKDG